VFCTSGSRLDVGDPSPVPRRLVKAPAAVHPLPSERAMILVWLRCLAPSPQPLALRRLRLLGCHLRADSFHAFASLGGTLAAIGCGINQLFEVDRELG
jgi:hypothetical protein